MPKLSKPKSNKLYSIRDYLNIGAHYTATGAVTTGGVATTLALGQPMLALIALGFTGVLSTLGIKVGKKMIEKSVSPYTENDPDAVNLKAIAQDLYQKSGLQAANNPIYNFTSEYAEEREKAEESQKRTAEMGGLGMMPNAMAMNFNKPVIMITRPLLKLLDAEEEKAVLAHEFAHAAARHTHTGLIQGSISSFGATAAGFALFTVALSGGFLPYLASISANLGIRGGAAFIGKGQMKQQLRNWKSALGFIRRPQSDEERKLKNERYEIWKKDYRDKDYKEKMAVVNKKLSALHDKEWEEWAQKTGYIKFPEPTLKQIGRRKLIGRIGMICATVAGAAILTAAVGPVYLGYMAAAWGVGYGAIFLTRHFQQSNELQADKSVIELGANPLALMTALRKIEAVYQQSLSATYNGETPPKKNLLTRAWENLNASHPTTSTRVKKLAKMAHKQGYAEADIKAAAEGSISIGTEHNIPPALIRMQMTR
jgi:Zn-dependent protease with chaperone function